MGAIGRFERISIHLMFLLIRVCFGGRKWHTISIHLMFLLIALPPSPGCPLVHFNTSHVSINRLMRIDQNGPNYHFNTSHVSINPQRIMSLTYSIRISIHLMFLLIWRVHHICTCRWCISIHLMFLLIRKKELYALPLPAFQYISCFY